MSRLCARWLALAVALGVLGAAPAVQAQTVCDTDPNAVPFTPTVDPAALNKLLARLGDKQVRTPNVNLTVEALCLDYHIPISTGVTTLPLGSTPFTVTPAPGSLTVGLDVPGPFEVGIDGGNTTTDNCRCRVELPYVGELVNVCPLEEAIVKPVLSLLQANVSWDDIRVTQTADTCVTGDCKAVHPLESSTVQLTNFDVDLIAGGSCNVFIDLPDPIPDIGPFDVCAGIDDLIADAVEPVLEDMFNGVFINRAGEGILIDVFSNQITKDFGCLPIPEVKECKQRTPVAGALRSPRDYGLNAIFYALPLGVVGMLWLRLPRSRSRTPRA